MVQMADAPDTGLPASDADHWATMPAAAPESAELPPAPDTVQAAPTGAELPAPEVAPVAAPAPEVVADPVIALTAQIAEMQAQIAALSTPAPVAVPVPEAAKPAAPAVVADEYTEFVRGKLGDAGEQMPAPLLAAHVEDVRNLEGWRRESSRPGATPAEQAKAAQFVQAYEQRVMSTRWNADVLNKQASRSQDLETRFGTPKPEAIHAEYAEALPAFIEKSFPKVHAAMQADAALMARITDGIDWTQPQDQLAANLQQRVAFAESMIPAATSAAEPTIKAAAAPTVGNPSILAPGPAPGATAVAPPAATDEEHWAQLMNKRPSNTGPSN